MANNHEVEKLIDMLYDMINDAKNMPLSSDKCVIDRDAALDLLDEIRAGLPAELKRAQDLIQASHSGEGGLRQLRQARGGAYDAEGGERRQEQGFRQRGADGGAGARP